jgi:hypothetical protein
VIQIYALKDPDSLLIKYIGKTQNGKYGRMSTHFNDKTNKEKYDWLMALKKENKEPIFEILCDCSEENWEELEMYHIEKALKNGAVLFNKTNGGLNKKQRKTYRIAISIDADTLAKSRKKANQTGHASVGSYLRGLLLKDVL